MQQPVPYDGDPSVFCSQEGGTSAGRKRERERERSIDEG